MKNQFSLPDDQKEFLNKKISETFRTYNNQPRFFLGELYNRTVQDVLTRPERNFSNIGAVKEYIAHTIACKLEINGHHPALNTILGEILPDDYKKSINPREEFCNTPEASNFISNFVFLGVSQDFSQTTADSVSIPDQTPRPGKTLDESSDKTTQTPEASKTAALNQISPVFLLTNARCSPPCIKPLQY